MKFMRRVCLLLPLCAAPLLNSCGSHPSEGVNESVLDALAPEGTQVTPSFRGTATVTAEPNLSVHTGPGLNEAESDPPLNFGTVVTVSDVKFDATSQQNYANIGRGWVDVRWLKKNEQHDDSKCSTKYDDAYAVAVVAGPTRAMLSLIGHGEGTGNCYNYSFGYKKFTGYADHPRDCRPFGKTCSTAAGRYQILDTTWDGIKKVKGLGSFAPVHQDTAATYLLERRDVTSHSKKLSYTEFVEAMKKMSWEWASFPPGRYGQGNKTYEDMWSKYTKYVNQ